MVKQWKYHKLWHTRPNWSVGYYTWTYTEDQVIVFPESRFDNLFINYVGMSFGPFAEDVNKALF